MQFTLPSWQAIVRRPALSLKKVVQISWWAALGLLGVLLALDAVVFYQFGLGRGIEPAPGALDDPGAIRVREDALRDAALLIEERRARFNAATSSAADAPNPFR